MSDDLRPGDEVTYRGRPGVVKKTGPQHATVLVARPDGRRPVLLTVLKTNLARTGRKGE